MNDNLQSGYVKIYRSTIEKGWYQNSEFVHLWVHLLFLASHKKKEYLFNGAIIKLAPGQFITSRKSLAEKTGIQESKIERILKLFKSEQQIEQQNLHAGRLISILNWHTYQISEQQSEQRMNSERTASEQRLNTINNEKNDKNEKKEKNKATRAKKNKRAASPNYFWDMLPDKFNQDEKFVAVWREWVEFRIHNIKKPLTVYSVRQQINFLSDQDEPIKIIQQSIMNDWRGLFELKTNGYSKKPIQLK